VARSPPGHAHLPPPPLDMPLAARHGPRGHAQSRRQPRDMSSGPFVQGTCPVAPPCRTGYAHPHTPARDMSSLRPNQRATCSLLSAISGQNGILPTDRDCGWACPVAMTRREEHALSCTSPRHMSGLGCGWGMSRGHDALRGTCSFVHLTAEHVRARVRLDTSRGHDAPRGTCSFVHLPRSMFRLGPALRGTCPLLNAISGQNGILPTDRDCG